MTIEETIDAYKKLSPVIFQKKWWTQTPATKLLGAETKHYWFKGQHLKEAVQGLLTERKESEELMFLEPEDPKCKVLVLKYPSRYMVANI
jgi:hypothetical protein